MEETNRGDKLRRNAQGAKGDGGGEGRHSGLTDGHCWSR